MQQEEEYSSSDSDAALGGVSCAISLGTHYLSDEEMDGNSQTEDVPLEMSVLSLPAQLFLESIQHEPFATALKDWMASERQQQPQQQRLETPSALAATTEASRQRESFSSLVEEKGSDEQKTLWADVQDADIFLSHLFLHLM